MSSFECAVLLLGFGGPDNLECVESFLKNVMNGRIPSPEVIKTIKERYSLIGGSSPLLEITRKQALALEKRLNASMENRYKVFVGMRFWSPYIKDSLSEIVEKGGDNIVAVSMSPYRSNFVESGYKKALDNAQSSIEQKSKVTLVSEWYANPHLHKAVAKKIKEGLSFFGDEEATVVFSAHSLPLAFMPADDPYVSQVEKTVNSILSIIGDVNWKLGYQSKGNIPGAWLEPSVDSILEDLATKSKKNILIVPVGFTSDHVETLYDIDIVYKEKAESLGLKFNRSSSLNDDPELIEALYETVKLATEDTETTEKK